MVGVILEAAVGVAALGVLTVGAVIASVARERRGSRAGEVLPPDYTIPGDLTVMGMVRIMRRLKRAQP